MTLHGDLSKLVDSSANILLMHDMRSSSEHTFSEHTLIAIRIHLAQLIHSQAMAVTGRTPSAHRRLRLAFLHEVDAIRTNLKFTNGLHVLSPDRKLVVPLVCSEIGLLKHLGYVVMLLNEA